MVIRRFRGFAAAAALVLLAAPVPPPAAAGSGPVEVHGELAAETRLYPEGASTGRDLEWDLGGELSVTWRASRRVDAHLTPRLWVDPLDPGRFRWVPREAWVEARAGAWQTRWGKQIVTWGSTLAWRPTDVLASRDYGRDFLDPEPRGDWMFTLLYSKLDWSLELAVLPWFEGSRLPSARSPWSMEQVAARFGIGNVSVAGDPVLAEGVNEQSLGIRVRRTLGSTDLHLVGYGGPDRTPYPWIEVRDGGQNGFRVHLLHPSLLLAGAGAQSAVGPVVITAEASWREQTRQSYPGAPAAPYVRPHSVQVVAGVDYLRQEALGRGDLELTLEYIRDDAVRRAALAPFRPFQNDLAAAAVYLAGDLHGTALELGWDQDLESAESVGRLRLRRRLGRALTAEVGGDLVLGPPDPRDPVAVLAANDRLTARLAYGF